MAEDAPVPGLLGRRNTTAPLHHGQAKSIAIAWALGLKPALARQHQAEATELKPRHQQGPHVGSTGVGAGSGFRLCSNKANCVFSRLSLTACSWQQLILCKGFLSLNLAGIEFHRVSPLVGAKCF